MTAPQTSLDSNTHIAFASHNGRLTIQHENRFEAFVEQLSLCLEEFGCDRPIFHDASIAPGHQVWARLESALRGSRFLIVIKNPAYFKSDWCIRELAFFVSNNEGELTNVVPVVLREIHRRPVEIELEEGVNSLARDIDQLNFCDVSEGPDDLSSEKQQKEIARLAERLLDNQQIALRRDPNSSQYRKKIANNQLLRTNHLVARTSEQDQNVPRTPPSRISSLESEWQKPSKIIDPEAAGERAPEEGQAIQTDQSAAEIGSRSVDDLLALVDSLTSPSIHNPTEIDWNKVRLHWDAAIDCASSNPDERDDTERRIVAQAIRLANRRIKPVTKYGTLIDFLESARQLITERVAAEEFEDALAALKRWIKDESDRGSNGSDDDGPPAGGPGGVGKDDGPPSHDGGGGAFAGTLAVESSHAKPGSKHSSSRAALELTRPNGKLSEAPRMANAMLAIRSLKPAAEVQDGDDAIDQSAANNEEGTLRGSSDEWTLQRKTKFDRNSDGDRGDQYEGNEVPTRGGQIQALGLDEEFIALSTDHIRLVQIATARQLESSNQCANRDRLPRVAFISMLLKVFFTAFLLLVVTASLYANVVSQILSLMSLRVLEKFSGDVSKRITQWAAGRVWRSHRFEAAFVQTTGPNLDPERGEAAASMLIRPPWGVTGFMVELRSVADEAHSDDLLREFAHGLSFTVNEFRADSITTFLKTEALGNFNSKAKLTGFRASAFAGASAIIQDADNAFLRFELMAHGDYAADNVRLLPLHMAERLTAADTETIGMLLAEGVIQVEPARSIFRLANFQSDWKTALILLGRRTWNDLREYFSCVERVSQAAMSTQFDMVASGGVQILRHRIRKWKFGRIARKLASRASHSAAKIARRTGNAMRRFLRKLLARTF